MNNFTSYTFLITSYSLNKLTQWFKLSRDENSLLNTPKLDLICFWKIIQINNKHYCSLHNQNMSYGHPSRPSGLTAHQRVTRPSKRPDSSSLLEWIQPITRRTPLHMTHKGKMACGHSFFAAWDLGPTANDWAYEPAHGCLPLGPKLVQLSTGHYWPFITSDGDPTASRTNHASKTTFAAPLKP
jgi:hypothetical protein